MIKLLFIGVDPRIMGGVERFTNSLCQNVDGECLFIPGPIALRSRRIKPMFNASVLGRILYKLICVLGLNDYIYGRYLELISKRYKPKYIVLNTPKTMLHLSHVSSTPIILVQHQTYSSMLTRKDYFNNDDNLIELVKNRVNTIVCLSPYDLEEFSEKGGFCKSALKVVRHQSRFSITSQPKKNNNKLVMICRIDNTHKRIDLALEAMNHLSDYTLHIYGEGPDESLVRTLATNSMHGNVFFHGKADDVKAALDECSIHVMTSDFEGYGISNIEAMSRGLPLIIRDTFTSAKDIVNGNGVLLNSRWSVAEFVEGVKYIEREYTAMSTRSIALSNRYNKDVVSKSWCEIFESINVES